jgi:AraC family transcriptional regulator, regulatory protein of adaptative response / methylphosphotriester-DNA alkyltransferase methyltransferase
VHGPPAPDLHGPTRIALTHAHAGERHLVRVQGDVDLATAPRLQTALAEAGRLRGPLVVDLADARVTGEEGAILLGAALRRLAVAHGDLTIVIAPGPLRERLERRGLVPGAELLDGRSGDLVVPPGEGAPMARRPPAPAPGARGERPATPWRRSALLAEATLVIERRHGELGLSLSAVAREIATSERQLQRVLADVGGTSFRDELNAARMGHAAELLAGDLPIGTISRRVGFRQPAQFAKAFRRHHGRSPTAFRGEVTAARPPLAR